VRGSFAAEARKAVYLLITIMLVAASHPHLAAQEVTSQAPPQTSPQTPLSENQSSSLPDEPGTVKYPVAEVVPPPDDTTAVDIESDTQSKTGSMYVLDGDVVVKFRDRVIKADHIEYDPDTGELTATGHLHATGGPNAEDITASHGTMNLEKQTGRFYDVTGSVGMKSTGRTTVYASSNPFLFTGRMVVRTGPQSYEIYGGTLTSCQLPRPDWMLYAGKFAVDSEKVKAQNSTFRVMNIPVLFLPYVTHPVDPEGRQSGILIPEISNSSTKGIVLGEQFYWAINRSADLTVGAQYYSLRGWEQSGTFRYRGLGNDFAKARYSGLLDRGITTGGVYLNQGGEDAVFSGRHDLSAQTRFVGDAEYLSSYAYREAFAESFSVAVSSDILSIAYGVHEANGYAESVRADRYQGLKMAATAATATTPAIPEEQVRIFHAPSFDFSSTEHAIGSSGLVWSLEASEGGLSRIQPNFSTGGLTQRLDLHPEIAYPMSFGGWNLRSSVGVRDTAYSRSRQTPYGGLTALPVELPNGINRSDVEAQVDLRAPVVERTFDSPQVEKFFGHDLRHTVEPEFTYRYVAGVNNFLNVLRFDDVDIASDTNELEYGVTQRLFLRPIKAKPCKEISHKEQSNPNLDDDRDQVPGRAVGRDEKDRRPDCGSREWIRWRLAQKLFFNQNFGGAVLDGRRNIFDTTLNFSGIAFLTEPRAISPLVSRMRIRTSAHMDVEWDFDFDTGAKKFTSDNLFLDVHENNWIGGLSYARLNAPGRFYTEGVSSAVSDFNQLRLLLGYGSPTKPGLGIAANVGLDLNAANSGLIQYGALQSSYNWDCCGLSVEYRKYELGSVRNESVERFNFTLLNIGTAGNLRHAESLF
jgi:LPS-assembly protein